MRIIIIIMVSALGDAWEVTTARAKENAARGNRAGPANRIPFREYKVGGKWNRVRVFKSVQYKEAYKNSMKFQVRYEGPYVIKEKISAVLYVTEINGVRKWNHAVNMKPVVRAHKQRIQPSVVDGTGTIPGVKKGSDLFRS